MRILNIGYNFEHKILLLFFLGLFGNLVASDKSIINWSFTTNGKIFSHPILDDNTIYFGGSDSIFYAVDVISGNKRWSYDSKSSIRSKAAIFEDKVYFNSGTSIYALNKNNGKEIWSFNNFGNDVNNKLDNWDYHGGAPAINKSNIYFGLNNGILIGLDLITGKIKSKFTTLDSAAIKCGLVIENSILYFADWNGKVYAFDLETEKNIWIYKTYNEKLYETFGQINTELLVYKDLLIFGGRNPELQIIDKKNGKKKWSYIEKDGGWISGDPIVNNDTLYIGGSDNHEMFAFNVFTGEVYWKYTFLNNNFSKPLLHKNYILFTTADAYSVYGTSVGRGFLYAITRKDGHIKNVDLIGGNLFSSPIVQDDMLFLSSEDGSLYAIDLNKFLNTEDKLINKGYNSVEILDVAPIDFSDKVKIDYQLNYETQISARITNLSEIEIKKIYSGLQNKGNHTLIWSGNDNSENIVNPGYYFFEISSGDYYKKTFVQKK